jgi:hypothetical protein
MPLNKSIPPANADTQRPLGSALAFSWLSDFGPTSSLAEVTA